MGGEEIDFIGLNVESTQAYALEGLEAAPLEEDVLAVKEVVVWIGKVRGLQVN